MVGEDVPHDLEKLSMKDRASQEREKNYVFHVK